MSRDKHRIATLLCLLGLWLQLIAPALALGMHGSRFDPRSTICHSAASGPEDHHGKSLPHVPACDHCLLCHALTGGLPADARPAFTVLDYPDAGPMRWAATIIVRDPAETAQTAQPRGPPNLI